MTATRTAGRGEAVPAVPPLLGGTAEPPPSTSSGTSSRSGTTPQKTRPKAVPDLGTTSTTQDQNLKITTGTTTAPPAYPRRRRAAGLLMDGPASRVPHVQRAVSPGVAHRGSENRSNIGGRPGGSEPGTLVVDQSGYCADPLRSSDSGVATLGRASSMPDRGPFRCSLHYWVSVSWRGTGCHLCRAEVVEARLRKRQRRRRRPQKRATVELI